MSRWSLENKVALVTGGTKGIGKSCVEELLALGSDVIFSARSSKDVASFENELKEKFPNRKIVGVASDITSQEDRLNMTQIIETQFCSHLDILVNNAGTNKRKPTTDYAEEEYDNIININQKSVFMFTKQCHPFLKNAADKSGDASVVMVSSVAGVTGVQSGAIYAMSKGALNQFTKYLSMEWGSQKIRVNAVCPWYTRTPLAEQVLENEAYLKSILIRTPMERVAEPEEISGLVAFLSMSGPAGYITGQIISADGGFTAYGFRPDVN